MSNKKRRRKNKGKTSIPKKVATILTENQTEEEICKSKEDLISYANHSCENSFLTTLSQFICIECSKVNAVIENESEKIDLYDEKEIYCRCCERKTSQIYIKDKTVSKHILEMSSKRTTKEENAYQLIKNIRRKK